MSGVPTIPPPTDNKRGASKRRREEKKQQDKRERTQRQFAADVEAARRKSEKSSKKPKTCDVVDMNAFYETHHSDLVQELATLTGQTPMECKLRSAISKEEIFTLFKLIHLLNDKCEPGSCSLQCLPRFRVDNTSHTFKYSITIPSGDVYLVEFQGPQHIPLSMVVDENQLATIRSNSKVKEDRLDQLWPHIVAKSEAKFEADRKKLQFAIAQDEVEGVLYIFDPNDMEEQITALIEGTKHPTIVTKEVDDVMVHYREMVESVVSWRQTVVSFEKQYADAQVPRSAIEDQ